SRRWCRRCRSGYYDIRCPSFASHVSHERGAHGHLLFRRMIRMSKHELTTKPEYRQMRLEDSFCNEQAESVVGEERETERIYDLEERTAKFGETVIDFAKQVPQNAITNRIISQLVGAATSVDANYVEADDAVSKKEFLKSIGTCRKEARETKHFLRMIV